MKATLHAIWDCGDLPMSVLVVGVGSSNFLGLQVRAHHPSMLLVASSDWPYVMLKPATCCGAAAVKSWTHSAIQLCIAA